MCDHSWQSINVKAVPALPLREVLIPLTVPTKYQIHKHRQNCEYPESLKNSSIIWKIENQKILKNYQKSQNSDKSQEKL